MRVNRWWSAFSVIFFYNTDEEEVRKRKGSNRSKATENGNPEMEGDVL